MHIDPTRAACKYVYVALPCRMPTQLDLLDSPRQCEISLHWLGTVHRFPKGAACKYALELPCLRKRDCAGIAALPLVACMDCVHTRSQAHAACTWHSGPSHRNRSSKAYMKICPGAMKHATRLNVVPLSNQTRSDAPLLPK